MAVHTGTVEVFCDISVLLLGLYTLLVKEEVHPISFIIAFGRDTKVMTNSIECFYLL